MKSLIENLGDLAGEDIVLARSLREASVGPAPSASSGLVPRLRHLAAWLAGRTATPLAAPSCRR